MKKLLGLTIVLILALPVIALAQDPAAPAGSQSTQQPGSAQTGAPSSQTGAQGNDTMGQSGKSGNVKGTVSQDGKTLVGDDGKSWTIANPDAVKGHEGHHVELKGSADLGHQPDPGQLRENAKGRQGLHEEGQLAAPITPHS